MPYYPYRQCPANYVPYAILPGDTLYAIAGRFGVRVSSITAANPGINPYNLMIGQVICIPAAYPSEFEGCRETIAAMQSDINTLKAESSGQSIMESNYGTSTRTTRAVRVTGREIQFDAAPVSFAGDWRGHYTTGRNYPYYPESAAGGQRGITVKDNFGVWHIFGYHVPVF